MFTVKDDVRHCFVKRRNIIACVSSHARNHARVRPHTFARVRPHSLARARACVHINSLDFAHNYTRIRIYALSILLYLFWCMYYIAKSLVTVVVVKNSEGTGQYIQHLTFLTSHPLHTTPLIAAAAIGVPTLFIMPPRSGRYHGYLN